LNKKIKVSDSTIVARDSTISERDAKIKELEKEIQRLNNVLNSSGQQSSEQQKLMADL
jgi:uncharacterized protein (DUF3084 family)